MSITYLPSLADQIAKTAAAFGGQPTRVLGVPHRICPLGAHVDHQGGISMGRAIGALTTLAYEPSQQSHIRLISADYEDSLNVAIGETDVRSPAPEGPLRTVAAGARALMRMTQIDRGLLGLLAAPADGAFLDAGLSSSASVLLAIILALADMNDLSLSPGQLIECVRIAENDILGIPNGVLDQSLIVHRGRRWDGPARRSDASDNLHH